MKFAGKIGFWMKNVEMKPGIFGDKMLERSYTGDISRNYQKWNTKESSTVDDLRLNNQISILSDLYAIQNWQSIKYVLWNGVRWKVNTIEISYPRLVLEIGGVWNGSTDETIGTTESP